MSADGFLSRMLGRDTDEYDSEAYYSSDEVETRRSRRSKRSSSRGVSNEEEPPPRDFIVERVAETIADLPPGVPQESAVLIVRKTLVAAGVKLSELDASTQAQESKLKSEIGLARNRQKEVQEKTQEQVRTLEGVRRVRAFFELPETESEDDTVLPAQEGTHPQVLEPIDADRAQISDTPLYPGGRDRNFINRPKHPLLKRS